MLAPSVRLASVDDPVADLVHDFEEAWRHGPPPLDRFRDRLDAGESAYGLAELVKADLRQRYQRGERPSARAYFDRYPALTGSDGHALSLIYEEYCLRAGLKEDVSPSEFCDRYPTWRDSLVSQLAYHCELSRAVEPLPSGPDFPEAGDRFGDYDLVRMLGQGGAARVFLARVSNLGGKEVVLKVSRDRGGESAVLGRLDHDNIVAVFATVVDPITGFRGLCMPYRPGLPLNEVVNLLRREGGMPRSASALAAVVDRGLSDSPVDEGRRHGWADFPDSGSYPDGVAWIGMKLALALAHAHGNGIFHRDVKPENVLLTRRDGPQLLDFNLAHDASIGDQARAAHRGGTLPYMSREHLQAFLNPSLWRGVGAEADIFSLGLILRELLTLKPVERPHDSHDLARTINDLVAKRGAARIPIRRINPRVPHALEAIVARCLAEAPEDRYAHALDLAKDLQRCLQRGPLVVARNPSTVEITGNWLGKRWRIAATVIAIASLIALASGDRRKPVPIQTPDPIVSEVPEGTLGRPSATEAPVPIVAATPATLKMIETAFADRAKNSEVPATDPYQQALAQPDAMDAFRIAAEAHPKSYSLAMLHGIASSKTRHHDSAVRAYRRATAIDPTAIKAHQSLAIALLEGGDPGAALDSIDRASALFRDDGSEDARRQSIRLHVNRSRILLQLGDSAKAVGDFPTARALFKRAEAHLAEIKEKSARDDDPYIKFSCEYLSTMIQTSLGEVAASLDEKALAVELFHSALEHVKAAMQSPAGREQLLGGLETYIKRRLALVDH